jgi:hypothetical protein
MSSCSASHARSLSDELPLRSPAAPSPVLIPATRPSPPRERPPALNFAAAAPIDPAMLIRALSSALSGLQSSSRRMQASSHNVANLLSDDFRPVRTQQSETREGGSQARTERAADPAPVDIATEFVEHSLAALQFRASLRVLDDSLELLGQVSAPERSR